MTIVVNQTIAVCVRVTTNRTGVVMADAVVVIMFLVTTQRSANVKHSYLNR